MRKWANTAIFIESIVNVNNSVAAISTAIREIGNSLIKTPPAAREPSADELEQLSPKEDDEVMACRVEARKAGFLKFD